MWPIRFRTAALAAPYGAPPMSPGRTAATDDTVTIVPPPRASMSGRTAWVSAYTPFRFTSSTLSHSGLPTQRIDRALLECPALLTRTSTRPSVSTVKRASATASVCFPTSAWRAVALPPARSISPTTCVRGSLRRPATTTCAPSAASIFAASRPMPLPPPVTIATCPSSRPIAPPQRRISEEYYVVAGAAPLPRPDRLLEVGDAGGTAVDDDLAQLIDDGGRRRVHERREDRHLDDGPVALGNRHEPRHVRPVEVGERHPVDARDLLGVRPELDVVTAPDDDRGDDEARARRIIVEQSEHRRRGAREAHLLLELAERGPLDALARVDAAPRQRPLARVGAEPRRPAREEEAGAPGLVGDQDDGDGGRPPAVGGDRPALEGGEMGRSEEHTSELQSH